MKLRGQHGYAMVVLLVGMAVMAVLATAVLPAWKQASQREKEAELAFRGEQYVRAIKLFSQRAGPGVLPPSLDVLVNQKFLRKKFKDPITGQDFDMLGAGQPAGNLPAGRGGRGGAAQPTPGGRGAIPPSGPSSAGASSAATSQAGTTGGTSAGTIVQGRGGSVAGGILGVASKSKDLSIRLYNGRTHYNEWQFVYVQQTQQPGATNPGPNGPGGPNGRGGPPGTLPQRGAPGPGGRSGPPSPGGPLPPGGNRGFSSPPQR
jgi:type II secretory pathway pseudopilin PulG